MNTRGPAHDSKRRDESFVLEAAMDALQTSSGISGKIVALEPRTPDGLRADAEVILLVDDRHYPYLVEIKQIDRIAMLHQIQQRFARTSRPCLLVAPRISAELAGNCREIGVQFIDGNGNAYLHAPGLLVLVTGQRHPKGHAPGDMLGDRAGGGGPSAARLTFALLCEPALLNAPYRVLSQISGVSLGAIGPVLNDLAGRGFISNTKGNRRFLERGRLLDEWVTTYPSRLRPKLAPRRFRAAEPDWWKAVNIAAFDAAWGGEVAADQLTGYLKPEKITIYMNPATMRQNLGKLVVQHKLRADPDGDIEVLEKFWDLPPETAPPESVPPLLAYADLVASMAPRNLEVATMIYQQLHNAN
jgi:hypothetical protein